MRIYILIDGQEHGPYGLEEMREHMAEGSFLPADLARTEDAQEWRPLHTVLPDPSESPLPATPSRPPLQTKRRFNLVVWLGISLAFMGVLVLMAAALGVFLFLPKIVQSPLFHPQQPQQLTSDSSATNVGASPVLVADYNAATENDWLATLIAREICSQAALGIAPDKSIPSDCFGAQALCETAPQLKIVAPNWPSGAVSNTLSLNYIWEPNGYAEFAKSLVSANAHPNADPRAATILTDLLNLTGQNLAGLDVEVSANLGKDASNPQLHEDAALLLCAMAWRENAGRYSETRQLLCRATAHLALAKALSGQTPSWNYQIAETALKVFAGREADSLSQISTLSSLPDCPPSAQIWLTCLKARILEDWRVLHPKGDSSLLEKITWAQLLCLDLNSTVAIDKLAKAGITDDVCDIGRAVVSDQLTISVENGHRFCESTIGSELKEIADINQIEKGKDFTSATLQDRLSEPESETITSGESGPELHVIGMNSFENATRRHLLIEIQNSYYWIRYIWGYQDVAGEFKAKMDESFGHLLGRDYTNFIENLRNRGKTTNVSQLPMADLHSFSNDAPSSALLLKFYGNALPWGTAFDAANRRQEFFAYDPFKEILSAPKEGFANNSYDDISALHPSCYRILPVSIVQKSPEDSPFLDYYLHSYDFLYDGHTVVPEKLRESLIIRQAGLDPIKYFSLGDFYVKQGLPDQAADAYRKGADQAIDPVDASNDIAWLLQYDLDHNNIDEAKKLADAATATDSEAGVAAHYTVALKLNQPDVAEQDAKKIQSDYGEDHYLRDLYHKRADYFPGNYDRIIAQAFPSGLRKVSLTDFSNKTPPSHGIWAKYGNERPADPTLMDGDVIVAINGVQIDTINQYYVYCDQLDTPQMELIVWRVNQYTVVEANPPNHSFGVHLFDYSP